VYHGLGLYQLPAGQQISVTLDLTGMKLGNGQLVGADAVLLALWQEPDFSQVAAVQKLEGRPVLFWMDDPAAEKGPDPSAWQPAEGNPGNWGGASILSWAPGQNPTVAYRFGHLLPGNSQYEIWAWIPAELQVPVQFEILLDGQVDKMIPLDSGSSGVAGTLFKLADYQAPEGEHSLEVTLAPQEGASAGNFAADIVLVTPVLH
jgi:hypothetical protein